MPSSWGRQILRGSYVGDTSRIAVPNVVCASPTSPPASPTYSWGRQHHGGGESYVGEAIPTMATLAATLATRIPRWGRSTWPTCVATTNPTLGTPIGLPSSWGRRILRGRRESYVGDACGDVGDAHTTLGTLYMASVRWRRRILRWDTNKIAVPNVVCASPTSPPASPTVATTNPTLGTPIGSPSSWGR